MNTFLTILELLLFVTAVVLAYLSWKTSNKSLKEAAKTRRDMSLPTVICKPVSSSFTGQYVWFYMQNVGHGIALNPQYCITGIAEVGVVKGYLTDGMNIAQVKPLDFLDHRISQGFHHLAFKLEHVDPNALLNSGLRLEITYSDVFKRTIRTTYALTLVEKNRYRIFQLDDLQIELP